MRVRLEAESVLAILRIVQDRGWTLVGSDVVDLERSKIKDAVKRSKVAKLCQLAHDKILTTPYIASRATELQALGFKALDSFHVAVTESSNVDILFTTDDKLENLAGRLTILVRVVNPLKWIAEEIS